MRRLPLLLVIVVAAALGLASCGGDDDGGGDTQATTPTETTTPQQEDGGAGGGAARVVRVSADPGGDLAFAQDSLTAQAGRTTFEFRNPASIPHDFRVEQDGNEVGGTDVITDDTAEETLDLEAGEYTFFCSVAGHRQAGMEGTLTVR